MLLWQAETGGGVGAEEVKDSQMKENASKSLARRQSSTVPAQDSLARMGGKFTAAVRDKTGNAVGAVGSRSKALPARSRSCI